jgi:hypothetical protein
MGDFGAAVIFFALPRHLLMRSGSFARCSSRFGAALAGFLVMS